MIITQLRNLLFPDDYLAFFFSNENYKYHQHCGTLKPVIVRDAVRPSHFQSGFPSISLRAG